MGNYLDNFTFIYINDVLIFFNNNKKDYINKIRKIIKYIVIVNLYLNPKKYEFTIKKIKYLKFIIIIRENI